MKELGIMRKWLQRNALNGSDVTWGSEDVVRFNRELTVQDFEALATEFINKSSLYAFNCPAEILWHKDHLDWKHV